MRDVKLVKQRGTSEAEEASQDAEDSVLADEILARDEPMFTLEEVRRELGLDSLEELIRKFGLDIELRKSGGKRC